jgi:hypothetical protein
MLTGFLLRANEIRIIAEGIFDNTERATVLKFVDDCEKLAASNFADS